MALSINGRVSPANPEMCYVCQDGHAGSGLSACAWALGPSAPQPQDHFLKLAVTQKRSHLAAGRWSAAIAHFLLACVPSRDLLPLCRKARCVQVASAGSRGLWVAGRGWAAHFFCRFCAVLECVGTSTQQLGCIKLPVP